jgi:hypothetical protein
MKNSVAGCRLFFEVNTLLTLCRKKNAHECGNEPLGSGAMELFIKTKILKKSNRFLTIFL